MYDRWIEEIGMAWSLLEEARQDRARLAMAIIEHKQRTLSGEYCTSSDKYYSNQELWSVLEPDLIFDFRSQVYAEKEK